jgi:signal recognition particle receptor subunit beta
MLSNRGASSYDFSRNALRSIDLGATTVENIKTKFVDFEKAYVLKLQEQKKKQDSEVKKRPVWDVFNVTSLVSRRGATKKTEIIQKEEKKELSPLKMIVLGGGKGAIMSKFRPQDHFERSSTIGMDFLNLTLGQSQRKVRIWDTSGQERYQTIVNSYYRDTHIVIVALSSDEAGSDCFKNLREHFQGQEVVVIADRTNQSHPNIGQIKRQLPDDMKVTLLDYMELDLIKEKLGQVVDALSFRERESQAFSFRE